MTEDERQAMARELELLEPDVRRSRDKLDGLLADDFVEIGASGTLYRKADVLASLPIERPLSFTATDAEVVTLSEGLVHLRYRVARVDLDANTTTHSRRSSIWQKTGELWRIRFHQGTPVPA